MVSIQKTSIRFVKAAVMTCAMVNRFLIFTRRIGQIQASYRKNGLLSVNWKETPVLKNM